MTKEDNKKETEINTIDRLYLNVAEIFEKYRNMDLVMKNGSAKEIDSVKSFFWNQAVGDVIFTYMPFTTSDIYKNKKRI